MCVFWLLLTLISSTVISVWWNSAHRYWNPSNCTHWGDVQYTVTEMVTHSDNFFAWILKILPSIANLNTWATKRISLQTHRHSHCASLPLSVSFRRSIFLWTSLSSFLQSLIGTTKGKMPVNSRRHTGVTSNSEQIKTTEGGIAHTLCNTHVINHISLSLSFVLPLSFSLSLTCTHIRYL